MYNIALSQRKIKTKATKNKALKLTKGYKRVIPKIERAPKKEKVRRRGSRY